MTTEQKRKVIEITERWHVADPKGLTVQQAAFDIGFLTAVVMDLEAKVNAKNA